MFVDLNHPKYGTFRVFKLGSSEPIEDIYEFDTDTCVIRRLFNASETCDFDVYDTVTGSLIAMARQSIANGPCECGAYKALKTPRGGIGHSFWCYWAAK
jgi:hypothetical protein